jgi:glutathione S-transferase
MLARPRLRAHPPPMTRPLTIVGSYVSPYVRKVLACLNLKGIPYEVDPITPFFGNDEFRRLSPLCRIPVLIDGDFAISDSSVICAYHDEAYPDRPLHPKD